MQNIWFEFLIIVKYIVAIAIVIAIALAPAYLAAQTKKDKMNNGIVRISSWLFGWTGIGWLIALFYAAKK